MTNIYSYNVLECVTQEFASITKDLWNKYFKLVNIIKCSKVW